MVEIKKCFKFDLSDAEELIKNITNDIDLISIKVTKYYTSFLADLIKNNKINNANDLIQHVVHIMTNVIVNSLLPIFHHIEKKHHEEIINEILNEFNETLKTGFFSVLAHIHTNDD